ncbi:MAG: ROK family protein [Rubrivivax sp.]|nr:ROK family protein [Rubrivivax sp.]
MRRWRPAAAGGRAAGLQFAHRLLGYAADVDDAAPRPDLAALGIDLGGTKIEAVLLADDGSVRWRQRVATPAGSYDATVAALSELVRGARAIAGGRPTIGIGTPGTVTADGRMKNCNSQCLNGRFLQRDLEAALGQPVAVANDANCLALSEATDGAGAGHGVVFAAILGTGVGAGIAVHGRVLTGPNGVAGEWGHNPLPWADAQADPRWRCFCGQTGCIETLLSGPGLARDHALVNSLLPVPDAKAAQGEAGGAGPEVTQPVVGAPDAPQIVRLAAGGDAAAQATLERHACRLARALAGVINVLDPDIIVLGGGLSRMPHLVRRVPQLWQTWVVSGGVREPVRTPLAASVHGDASGVRGAAWLGRARARAAA